MADRLRAILGDLRLPILDDLGTGSALEWLVERVERLADGEVRLERADKTRPPADVELAFFRVAQEALSNAIRHGRPPIVVRYWTSPSAAALSIDDAGDGFDPSRVAPTPADGDGHFGMLNMRQRAEQIGALLDFRRWPAGGTQVSLGVASSLRRAMTSEANSTRTSVAQPASAIRVAVVDDHPVLRDGIASLLEQEADLEVVAKGGDLAEAMAILASPEVDVLVLDVRLGTTSGLTALQGSSERRPAIVVLTAYAYPQYAQAALRLGASAFVLKSAPIQELIEAIRKAAAGGLSFGLLPGQPVALTARELEVSPPRRRGRHETTRLA